MTAQPAQAVALPAAALSAASATALAWQHPLSPVAALAGVATVAWLAWRHPFAWLLLLPALLPLASLAPWTGWIVVEEFDLLVLATAAGGLARQGWRPASQDAALPSWTRGERAAVMAVAAWTCWGLGRGLADAGGLGEGLFQGQADPLNSWRVAKSAVFALLLYPLLREAFHREGLRAFERLALGMVAGAALLCLLVARERAAFPGLLDWQVPYRTTAWFWDMHVGGAAIDAYLAITTPFVAWALWSARRWWRWLAAALLAVAWTYAGLTTYARGAYLGAGVALFVLGLRLPAEGGRGPWRAARLALLAAGILVPVWIAIEQAGHAAGLLLLALAAAGLGLWRLRQSAAGRPPGARALAVSLLALGLLFEAATVVGPDSYMWSRVGGSGRDGIGRFTHWAHGLALIRTPVDAVAGIGLGRVPTHYDHRWPREEFSGRAGWQADGAGGGLLRLSGPRTLDAVGGLFGITRRVDVADTYVAGVRLRAAMPVDLLVRVCESHLLYDRACQAGFQRVIPAPDPQAWQELTLALVGPPLDAGASWARREAVLTLSVTNAGAVAEVDRVTLRGADGRPRMPEAGFDQGLARWWPVAQFHFLPWHVDNLYIELLVERGLVGLLLAAWLLRAAWRAGPAPGVRADGPATWFAQAALAGGLCVGLVSSLVDVPRVAWLLWLMVMVLFAARHLSPPHRGAAP